MSPESGKKLPISLPNLPALSFKQLGSAYEEIEKRLNEFSHKPAEQAKELISHFGQPARSALYALLCEEKGSLYKTAQVAIDGGAKSAAVALAPILVAQFALPAAAAFFVATLAAKIIAEKGSSKLCAELAKMLSNEEQSEVEPPSIEKEKTKKPTTKPAVESKPKKPAPSSAAARPTNAPKPKKPSSSSIAAKTDPKS